MSTEFAKIGIERLNLLLDSQKYCFNQFMHDSSRLQLLSSFRLRFTSDRHDLGVRPPELGLMPDVNLNY